MLALLVFRAVLRASLSAKLLAEPVLQRMRPAIAARKQRCVWLRFSGVRLEADDFRYFMAGRSIEEAQRLACALIEAAQRNSELPVFVATDMHDLPCNFTGVLRPPWQPMHSGCKQRGHKERPELVSFDAVRKYLLDSS